MMMKVGQDICRELRNMASVIIPMGVIGTVAAYALSQNIVVSIAAGACAPVGLAAYFCTTSVVKDRQVKVVVALVMAVGLAVIFHVPVEIFVLTTLVSLIASRYFILMMCKDFSSTGFKLSLLFPS